MSRKFISDNNKSRYRLRSLVERLSDQDFAKATAAGWTVSSLLAHLAFWDQRAVILLRVWKEAGVSPSPVDINVVNDAAKVLCLAIEAKI